MKKIIQVLLVVLGLCGIGCGAYLADYYHAEDEGIN